jgi:hypothetical protein
VSDLFSSFKVADNWQGLVMELVSGGDLFDYITKNGYLCTCADSLMDKTKVNTAEDLSGRLTAQLCDAMAVSHFFENDIARTNHFRSIFTFRGSLTATSNPR